MSKLLTQCSEKIVAIVVRVVLVVGIVSVNFEKWSVITSMYWLLLFVFGRGPKMAMAKNSTGSITEDNRIVCSCFLVWWLCAHDLQSLTVSKISFTLCRQYYWLCILSYIRLSSQCTASVE